MTTGRLEAFSDGVLAIVITIMVLELKVPEGSTFETLRPLLPKFISYVLSFTYIGIYWNNHHHLFQAVEKVNGKILWANLFLLFSLSMIPFTTGWMGENHFDKNPTALYGLNLLACAFSFVFLQRILVLTSGKESNIAKALKNPIKEYISVFLYILGVVLSFYWPKAGVACYMLVAVIWLIPDTRIEDMME